MNAKGYLAVAENFCVGADMAREFEYWNASGVLTIHAAIAFADEITDKRGGVKCQGENHLETIALVESLVPRDQTTRRALSHIRSIPCEKTAVSNSSKVYEGKDVEKRRKLL